MLCVRNRRAAAAWPAPALATHEVREAGALEGVEAAAREDDDVRPLRRAGKGVGAALLAHRDARAEVGERHGGAAARGACADHHHLLACQVRGLAACARRCAVCGALQCERCNDAAGAMMWARRYTAACRARAAREHVMHPGASSDYRKARHQCVPQRVCLVAQRIPSRMHARC